MAKIQGEGAEAIRTLSRIDKLLQSDVPTGDCALLISQEIMKFKAKTDVLDLNPGRVKP